MSYVALAMAVVGDITARSESGDWTGVSGGIFGSGAKKDGKAGKDGKNADGTRNPSSEIADFMPQMLDLAKEASGYQLALNRQAGKDALGLYTQATDLERGATNKQRGGDVKAIGKYGPRLMSYLERLNPEWAAAANRLDAAGEQTPLLRSMNTSAMDMGTSPINARLYGDALADLENGGRLSPDQIRQVQQDSRGAFSARGMLNGDASAFDEVLNLQNAQLARLRERQAFAQSASANLLNELSQDRAYGMGVEGLNLQRGNFLLGSVGAQQQRLNPLLGILTARSTVPLGTGAALMGAAPQVGGLINSLLGYGAGANDFNANAAQAAQISAANNQAALYGSLINTAGKAVEGYQTYQSRQPATTTSSVPNGGAVSGYTYSPSTGYTATV